MQVKFSRVGKRENEFRNVIVGCVTSSVEIQAVVIRIGPNVPDDSKDIDFRMSVDNIFRRKYQLMLERIEVLEQDNKRNINRVQQAEKIRTRRFKDVKLLMERLDRYRDAYKKVCAVQETRRQSGVRAPGRPLGSKNLTPLGKIVKNKDPNAPKKPCNAFFQFCQEQRPIFIANNAAGPRTRTKKGVTKQLASKWRSLTTEDKKVYVAMFEKSKEKYAQAMAVYIRKDHT